MVYGILLMIMAIIADFIALSIASWDTMPVWRVEAGWKEQPFQVTMLEE
jgi:hypothetical protein